MLTRDMLIQGLPVLGTERLVLRSLRQSDYSALAELLSHPQVIRYVNRGSQSPPIRARKLLNQIRSSSTKLDSLHYGICCKGSEQVIGIASFQHWNDQKGTAQIGYILSKLYWGKGLATEAVHRLLTFGFDELHLWRVEARCYEANLSSERVLLKMGMLYERSLPAFGLNDDDDEVGEGSNSMNVKVYGMSRGQFQSGVNGKSLHSPAWDNPEIS
ncbi:ribosomal-protein-alanine N-acetyltransferase [Paenibacillus sp. JGP012]|uniref:GNAT family N-acetyltransferase n=1 Tax=Paenibacillus sp. JGP012 TaxID=2735914 RepID=UPI00160E80C6|nr:GNAT family N-acetyltransferase [Paenibacillus sp. JGP012]MBB6020777.1 ribosomal-protein-alanine N-acetyltransferase [Paenibacillus sp. JGP012]